MHDEKTTRIEQRKLFIVVSLPLANIQIPSRIFISLFSVFSIISRDDDDCVCTDCDFSGKQGMLQHHQKWACRFDSRFAHFSPILASLCTFNLFICIQLSRTMLNIFNIRAVLLLLLIRRLSGRVFNFYYNQNLFHNSTTMHGQNVMWNFGIISNSNANSMNVSCGYASEEHAKLSIDSNDHHRRQKLYAISAKIQTLAFPRKNIKAIATSSVVHFQRDNEHPLKWNLIFF